MGSNRAQVRLDPDVLEIAEAAAYDGACSLSKAVNDLLREAAAHECVPTVTTSVGDAGVVRAVGGNGDGTSNGQRTQRPATKRIVGNRNPRLAHFLDRNAGR